jgi:alpha-1,2-mannosyltransferase
MGPHVHVYPYLYPPPSLLLFYPLSVLDYDTARHTVLLVNHVIILALLWVMSRFFLRGSPTSRVSVTFALVLVYSLTFYPTVVTLNHGQVNLLLLALLLAFWFLASAGSPVPASLFLALAVFLKTYPLIILPMLLVTGHRRECVYTCVWLGLGAIVSWLILPSGIWSDWLVNVLPTGGYTRTPTGLFSPAAVWNQSLNGFFARAFTESQWFAPVLVDARLARLLTYATAGLVVAISGVAVWRDSRIHTNNLARTMLVALPAMYLVSPLSWEHHLVYLLPSILMLLTARSTLPTVATLLFSTTTISSAILIGLDRGLEFKFYGVVVLWALCIFAAFSRRIQLPNNGMESDE